MLRAYNDWVAEFCAYDPKRLTASALISLEDIRQGVEELERIAKHGMRGAMIWGSPPEDRPYSDPALRSASGRPPPKLGSRSRCTSSPARAARAMTGWATHGSGQVGQCANPGVWYLRD